MITRKSAAKKGKDLQKYTAHALAFITGLTTEDFYSARGGTKERDIHLSKAARELWPYHTECKNHRKLQMAQFLKQAESDAKLEGLGFTPVLVFKRHGQCEPYLALSLIDFLDLRFGPLTAVQRISLKLIFQGNFQGNIPEGKISKGWKGKPK